MSLRLAAAPPAPAEPCGKLKKARLLIIISVFSDGLRADSDKGTLDDHRKPPLLVLR